MEADAIDKLVYELSLTVTQLEQLVKGLSLIHTGLCIERGKESWLDDSGDETS